jgi:CBS domain-containing protein
MATNPGVDSARSEWSAVVVAIGSVAIGLAVVWLAQRFVQPIEGSVLIALMLLPFFVYLIASGKLAEFKAPGGIEAKFAQAAAESVRPASETVAYDDPQVIAKETIRSLLDRKTKEIDESKPVVMTMSIGGTARYGSSDIAQYLKVLTQFRNFKFIVFLDKDQRFVAYMPSWALNQLVTIPELADEFVNAVNQGQIAQVLRYPGVVKRTISTKSTNAEALREMQEQNIEALVVIDDQQKLRGVVEREQVLGRMMLSLVR